MKWKVPRLRTLIFSGILLLLVFFMLNQIFPLVYHNGWRHWKVATVHAQLPFQIELACPAGTTPLPFGVTNDIFTGKIRQNYCVDSAGNITTNAFIASPKIFSNLRFADQFTGANCGVKINAAIASLPSTGGWVGVNANCGQGTATSAWSAVTIPANVAVQIIEPSNLPYWTNTITMGSNSSLYGLPMAMAVNTTPLVQLKLGNGINPANWITIAGTPSTNAMIRDLNLDGNNAGNPTGGPALFINNTRRVTLDHLVIGNSNSHGINMLSTGTTAASSGAKFLHIMVYQNNGDGIHCQGTGDVFVSHSEFENNGLNGINLSDCPTWRVSNSDIGQNGVGGGDGVHVTCTAAGIGSRWSEFTNNQFGNEYQNGINIIASDGTGGDCALGWMIVGNEFLQSGFRTPDNTFSNIVMVDSAANTITGNSFQAGTSPHAAKSAMSFSETGANRAFANQISANAFSGPGTFLTATYIDTTAGGVIGQQFVASGLGPNSSWDFIDTSASPTHKYMRNGGGSLQILNNGFTSVLFQITDAGLSQYTLLGSAGNCSSSASPAVCGASPNGSVVVAVSATTVIVNTTAVTANSQITVTNDDSLGTKLGVTCNTNLLAAPPAISARTPGTSFTIAISSAPVTNPECFSYSIVN